jgi:hypothetical protein
MLEPQPEDPRDGVGDRDYPFWRNPSERLVDLSLEVLVRAPKNRYDLHVIGHVSQDGVGDGRKRAIGSG